MAYFHLLFHRISRNLPFAESEKGAVMKLMLKGFLIGAFMLIPGVSGGTMAMIFGIYEKLLSCISSFSSHKKENFLFLFRFMIGSGASFLLLSRPLSGRLQEISVFHQSLFSSYFSESCQRLFLPCFRRI